MEQFIDSSWQSSAYPANLISPTSYSHTLHAYATRFNEIESHLCCRDENAALEFWEYDDQGRGFQYRRILNLRELEDTFGDSADDVSRSFSKDPRCRFVFISAHNSRERLAVTRSMLSTLFTHYQVIPAFLDFVFTFDRRHFTHESHFGGFKYELRLADALKGPSLPQLGRSGRDIRHCYNLRAAESSQRQKSWPWSIRQTAVYHCFDVTSGRATWIVVKGDKQMQTRIKNATEPYGQSALTSFETNSQAFSSSLFTHLIYTDWCGESWKWYIDFLEEEAQNSTGRAFPNDAERLAGFAASTSFGILPKSTFSQRQTDAPMQGRPHSAASSLGKSGHLTEKPSLKPYGRTCTPPTSFGNPTDTTTHPQRPGTNSPSPAKESVEGEQDFSFSSLQKIQFLEEKTNEAMLVIDINLGVLAELKNIYESMAASNEFPGELKVECGDDIERFSSRVYLVENDLKSQRSRACSLLQLLGGRRSLWFYILEYRNMEASRISAEKAQRSAISVEGMTRDVHSIAVNAKKETVSMRIITLATLFFLPGTFVSTLMSTDIIRWQSDNGASLEKTISLGALQFFMEITIPLMLISFTIWYTVYWWAHRRQNMVKIGEGSVEP